MKVSQKKRQVIRYQPQGEEPVDPYNPRGKLYYYAWWLGNDGRVYVRGPKDNLSELNATVARVWHGHYEVEELRTYNVNKAKAIIRDVVSQKQGSLTQAMQNYGKMKLEGEK